MSGQNPQQLDQRAIPYLLPQLAGMIANPAGSYCFFESRR
jgi:hypothetical protein